MAAGSQSDIVGVGRPVSGFPIFAQNRRVATTTLIRLAAAVVALAIWPAAAMACIRVGVYQDRPATSFPRLRRRPGRASRRCRVYVGARRAGRPARDRAGQRAAPAAGGRVAARRPHGDARPRRRRALRRRRCAASSASCAASSRSRSCGRCRSRTRPGTRGRARSRSQGAGALRPRLAARATASCGRRRSGRIRLMWTPYARSVPDEPGNRIRDYFPGRDLVDAVGAVGYNFGTTDVLDWTAPAAAVRAAYATIDRLARKPFWMAETGSTGLGGSKPGWIGQLGAIRTRCRGCAACSGTTSASRTATSASRRRPPRRRRSRVISPAPASGSGASVRARPKPATRVVFLLSARGIGQSRSVRSVPSRQAQGRAAPTQKPPIASAETPHLLPHLAPLTPSASATRPIADAPWRRPNPAGGSKLSYEQRRPPRRRCAAHQPALPKPSQASIRPGADRADIATDPSRTTPKRRSACRTTRTTFPGLS